MTLTQIERETAKLPLQNRNRLACSLLSTCNLQAVEKAWIAEVEDRERALASGRISTISASKAIEAALIMIHRQRG